MTRLLVGTSWKMHLTSTEARSYFRTLVPLVADIVDRDLFVLPPFTSLWVAREELAGTRVAWGAQDVHEEPAGAHTGDVSAPMLVDLGCRYVEVGHPERRRDHGETDRRIRLKVGAAIRAGLEVILSVGEPGAIGERGARAVVLRHLGAILGGLDGTALDRVIVAYEPAWAIGAGATVAPTAHILAVHRAIADWLSSRACATPRVVYGGSVDRAACDALLSGHGVDGVFVGRAGLDPVEFARIAHVGLRQP